MDDVEAFFDRRCELIEGEIIDKSPASARHALAIEVSRDFFARSLPMGMCSGSQTPVVLGTDSEPEPDVWWRMFPGEHSVGKSRKPAT